MTCSSSVVYVVSVCVCVCVCVRESGKYADVHVCVSVCVCVCVCAYEHARTVCVVRHTDRKKTLEAHKCMRPYARSV
jgi:hypothetical protein